MTWYRGIDDTTSGRALDAARMSAVPVLPCHGFVSFQRLEGNESEPFAGSRP